MSEISNNNCWRILFFFAWTGKQVGIRLVLCFRFGHSEHQTLLSAVVLHGPPNRWTINHLCCHHFSSLLEFPDLGTCRRQGKVSLCPCPCPCHIQLVLPQTSGHSGPSAPPWPGLGEAAVPANGVGGSPAATQRSGVLQTMAAPAPHMSLSKEPCFWIIYATFRWKYFVFYSVDAFFFYNEALIKTNMCVILSGKYMLKCHFEYEIIHF